MKTAQEIEAGLRNFYGTEAYTRYNFGILLTDGVRWLCENADCFWLVDVIGSYQHHALVKNDESLQGIQFWTLTVDLAKKTGVVRLDRDEGDEVLCQATEYTDFPLAEIKLYYSPADKVLLLPSEY